MAIAPTHPCLKHTIQRLEAIFSFSLVDHWVATFQRIHRFVTPDTNIDLSVFRRRFQKGDVTAVHHIKASRDQNFPHIQFPW